MKTRILIVDDHEIIVEGLKAALRKHPHMEIVGEASDGREAVQKAQTLRPQVVIMDIAMPHFNGIEATYQLKKALPDVKVIIFTMHSCREFLAHLMKAGISAYVLKQNPISDIYLAIDAVKRGGSYFSENAPALLAAHIDQMLNGKEQADMFQSLSVRQREIFQLLAEGISIRQAAVQLSISPKTVETHKYHIMEKLQIRSMAEWTKEAIRRGVVSL